LCLTYIEPRRFGNGVEATFYNRDIFITLLRAGRFGGVKRAPRGNSMGQMDQRVLQG
jgi:hypothetical protein